MNANELADELEKVIDVRHYASEVLRKEVIKTLRQQQAEIEALTAQFVRVADQNNRLKDQIEMLKKGKVEYGYDTTKTS